MPKYTALTIGPIYQTIGLARKTRELWAASFIFSKLMGNIIEGVSNKKNIIIPYADEYPKLKDVGLYPDRLLYEGEMPDIDAIIAKSIETLAEDIGCNTKTLADYLQVYYFVIDDTELENVGGDNEIFKLNSILDSLELQKKNTSASCMTDVVNMLKNIRGTNLWDNHFKEYYSDRVMSTDEIATAEITTYDYDDSDRQTFNQILSDKKKQEELFEYIIATHKAIEDKTIEGKENKPPFHNYHKYVAVISADGDKMGQFIKDCDQTSKVIKEISTILFDWAQKASQTIKDFNGLPIYAGGDDLLCFAPIVCGGKNIIDVLRTIEDDFKSRFKRLIETNRSEFGEDIKCPTLSFGVSIAYYKYPLAESLECSHGLLRKMKGADGNGICLKMLKHSGVDFEMMLKEGDKWNELFGKLMKTEGEHNELISSIAYHLQESHKVIDQIKGDADRLGNFFFNNIEGYANLAKDESEHFLNTVKKMVVEAYKKPAEVDGKAVNRMLPVYDMLRLVKFLKGLDKNNE